MKRILIGLFVVGGTLLASSPIASAKGSLTCDGPLVGQVIGDNVVVPHGATCALDGDTINGNANVASGSSLQIEATTINGNVAVVLGSLVESPDGELVTVTGNYSTLNALSILGDASFGGNVSFGGGSYSLNGDSIGGTLAATATPSG